MPLVYFKIIRPINLLLIILAQILIKYTLLTSVGGATALSPLYFVLLVLATVLIAAGGNVINDLYDVDIDLINKPEKVNIGIHLSEKAALNYYIGLTLAGVSLGFVLANHVEKPALNVIFIGTAALLYVYASSIKSILIVGNLIISGLVGLSLLLVILFDIFPAINEVDRSMQLKVSGVVGYYAVAAVYFNLMREWVKDIEDMNGDKNGGRNTLPIVLGAERTKTIVFGFGVLAFFMLVLFCYYYLYTFPFLLFYFLILLGGVLLLFCIKTWHAEKPKHYGFLSLLLKIIMLLGVGSIPFYAKIL